MRFIQFNVHFNHHLHMFIVWMCMCISNRRSCNYQSMKPSRRLQSMIVWQPQHWLGHIHWWQEVTHELRLQKY